ncbi:MAG: DUF4276 family protein [Proteobacteria bacterium]|nr:DUF4276 family protein [Pseudomonadota bacterium]
MALHVELLVEEPSMEAFLRELLPRVLPAGRTFAVYPFQGKSDLLGKLPDRLRGYARFLPDDWRIVVVVDRDDDDCRELKQKMEAMAKQAGLRTRSRAGSARWQVVNRIAIEELEAWYFGDWQAVCEAYPHVSPSVRNQRAHRHSDAVAGGTWEAFERVMKRHGYFRQGLRKIEAARALGKCVEAARSDSASFLCFHRAVMEAAA